MALQPFSGSTPACAARPWNQARTVVCVGAAITTPPTGPEESNTAPTVLRSRPGSNCLMPVRAVSSPTVNSSS